MHLLVSRVVAALLLLVAGVGSAEAQYFGRNRVQWEDFDFKVLQTQHFDFYYYPQERRAVELAARMAERWYARLSKVLNHQLRGRQPVIIYAAHPHFRQTNALPSQPGVGTGGVTELFKRRIVLPFAGSLAETDHVLGHELVHAFQFDITGNSNGASAFSTPGALRLPLWFIEGMAEYLSVGPVDPHTTMWMRGAMLADEMPELDDLENPANSPYRFGHALWAYIAGRWGDPVVGELLRVAGATGDAFRAIEEVLGVKTAALSEAWHEATRRDYRRVARGTRPPSAAARRVIGEEEADDDVLDLAPAISPDGSKLAFLSTRDLFSMSIYLADVETGRIERKLLDTTLDRHFDSLQFIESSGGWSRDGRLLAVAAVEKGQPVVSLIDTERGGVQRKIRLEELGEVFNPAFSPDGRRIAFSALAGGLLDLFVYDLETGRLQRLTDDIFAELHPAWSPDGATLVFSTDRFGADPNALQFARMQLARIDAAGGRVEPLPGLPGAKHINPEWSFDGRSLFFLADPSGVTNVFRLELATGRFFQVTDVVTGVSGITALSPSLSAASGAPRIVFSAYGKENILNLYEIGDEEALRGRPLETVPARLDAAAVLPGADPAKSMVYALLHRPAAGLPPAQQREVSDYDANLSLDYIGQPTLQVGTDALGTFVGGGIAFAWSDVLGNHQLATTLRVSGNLQDAGGQVGYENRDHRWTWGVLAERLPLRTGSASRQIAQVDGTTVVVDRIVRSREIHNNFLASAAYPFSQALRFETFGGLQYMNFDRTLDIQAVSVGTGRVLIDEERDLQAPDSISLARAGAALVHDSTLFGLTSPILGRRFRLEFAQSAGTLNFSNLLGDFRQYLMPIRPYTIAARVLHYGRYGADANDTRLLPLFLGYPHLVRGYDVGSFEANECGVGTDCPVLDQLLGSRLLVANLELRFPLWGGLGGDRFYGPIPVELAVFGDAGIAWTSDVSPSFAGGDREFVKSVGFAARANLFNYAVVEIDFVRPLDRPGRGWLWQFNFTPGF